MIIHIGNRTLRRLLVSATTQQLSIIASMLSPKTIPDYKKLLTKTDTQDYIDLSLQAFADSGETDIQFEVSLEEYISAKAAQDPKLINHQSRLKCKFQHPTPSKS